MQWDEPGTAEIIIRVEESKPAKIHFKGNSGKGIWINALELMEWDTAVGE